MDIRRLRAFAEVARQGSFSAAADALNYTQPALSQQIAALEREFGVPLLKRKVRPVRPTPAGAKLLDHATAILDRVTLAENQLRAIAETGATSVRIGSFPAANATFVPVAMAGFLAESDDVRLTLVELEPADAARRLAEGEIDIAVIYDFPGLAEACEEGVDYYPLLNDAFSLVTPSAAPALRGANASGGGRSPRQFLGTFTAGLAADYEALVGEVAAEGELAPRIVPETTCTSTAQALVAAGLGVALLPELALTRVHPGVAVRPLPGSVVTRRILAALPRDRAAVSPVERMLAHIRTAAERRARVSSARFSARHEALAG